MSCMVMMQRMQRTQKTMSKMMTSSLRKKEKKHLWRPEP